MSASCQSIFSTPPPSITNCSHNCFQKLTTNHTSYRAQVSAQVDGQWKSLGRALALPETELMCIEQANRGDRQQCAYQTLLRWRHLHPQRYTCGVLYQALCDCSSAEAARRCCGGSDVKQTPCWHCES